MSIYIPYFYIIQEIATGMYYAGSKYAVDAHPNNFMVEGGYQTSSTVIRSLIEQNGLETFVIRKIKTFGAGQEAYDYETKFLQKINAASHPSFYNMHNNDFLSTYHDLRFKENMIRAYGVEHPLHSEEIYEKHRRTCIKRYGAPNVFCKDSSIRKDIDETFVEKYGVVNISQLAVTQEKITATSKNKRNVEHHLKDPDVIEKRRKTVTVSLYTDEQKETILNKRRATNNEKYGCDQYNNREKALGTIKEKYNIDYEITNISQIPEIKEKSGDSIRKTKSDKTWKETKGKAASKKLSATLNSDTWKNTVGVKKSKKLSIIAKNREKKLCPHCSRNIDPVNYRRWHGDKCKNNPCLI